jgi:hypothetical protein
MTEIEAIIMLQTRPLDFLRKNAITPITMPGPAGIRIFYMTDVPGPPIQRPGKLLGNLSTHEGQRFRVGDSQANGGTPFNAVCIPVQESNIPINPFPLPLQGPGVMITTQLTGCCIVMIHGAGTWSVAHLHPQDETGFELRQRLSNHGLKVYGATDYSIAVPSRAALVGVRINSNWGFYTQIQDGFYNVMSVNKLSS